MPRKPSTSTTPARRRGGQRAGKTRSTASAQSRASSADEQALILGPTGMDGIITDPDVATVFKQEQIGHGEKTGRQQMWRSIQDHGGVRGDLRAGDIDSDWEDAEFVGEEAPGGGQPTPDQDNVDDVGRATGLVYQDNEPLDMQEKVERRDVHRWELDPASAEDYPSRVQDAKEFAARRRRPTRRSPR